MVIDDQTAASLELVRNLADGSKHGTLCGLFATRTASGGERREWTAPQLTLTIVCWSVGLRRPARFVRDQILKPLTNIDEIEA